MGARSHAKSLSVGGAPCRCNSTPKFDGCRYVQALSTSIVSNSSIASLRCCASSYGLSRGSLARDGTEITHQLSGAFKSGRVTDFRGEGDSDNQIDPAQHLQGSNNLVKKQFGTNSSITFSSRSTHSFEMRTALTISRISDVPDDQTTAPATSADTASSNFSCEDRCARA